MPKAYHLKKKDLLGKWLGEYKLYLSDSAHSLRYVTGDYSPEINVNVDVENRIVIPTIFENSLVVIKGCISTIEVTFMQNIYSNIGKKGE